MFVYFGWMSKGWKQYNAKVFERIVLFAWLSGPIFHKIRKANENDESFLLDIMTVRTERFIWLKSEWHVQKLHSTGKW